MNFFVKLRPDGLLDDLEREERHDRRRHLITLLEAHGTAAREVVIQRLEAAAKDREQTDPFFLRNLIYLLRILPRPAEASAVDEVMLIGRTVRSTSPLAVVKEAISTLGKIEHEAAEDALLAYLRRFESMLESPRAGAHPREETEGLLERTVSALARAGGGRSLKAVVEHGLRDAPELGNTKQRLAELGYRDLTPHPELVLRLLAALEAELPRGLVTLGGVIINKRKSENINSLIGALRGTRVAEVWDGVLGHLDALPQRELRTGGIAGARDAGRGAALAPAHHRRTLGRPGGVRPAEPAAEPGRQPLLGDADAVRRGRSRHRHDRAGEGQRAQRTARRPARSRRRSTSSSRIRSPGSSRSWPRANPCPSRRTATRWSCRTLLLEGVRRYDELRLARALVPDQAVLKPTGLAPSGLADEPNEALVESLWEAAVSGATPAQCERKFPVDSYRIRRLLAHWVEKGALQAPGQPKEAPRT